MVFLGVCRIGTVPFTLPMRDITPLSNCVVRFSLFACRSYLLVWFWQLANVLPVGTDGEDSGARDIASPAYTIEYSHIYCQAGLTQQHTWGSKGLAEVVRSRVTPSSLPVTIERLRCPATAKNFWSV